jgi:hypothetical protein
MVDQFGAKGEDRLAPSIGINGPSKDGRNIPHKAPSVTSEAVIIPVKSEPMIGGMWIKAVEYWSQPWVHSGNFEEAAGDPAHVTVIAKVDCPGVTRVNPVVLETCFGVDQNLAGLRDVQLPQ